MEGNHHVKDTLSWPSVSRSSSSFEERHDSELGIGGEEGRGGDVKWQDRGGRDWFHVPVQKPPTTEVLLRFFCSVFMI